MNLKTLIELNKRTDKLIELQRRYDADGNEIDDGPGLGTAAVGAGILGAGYAGQSMYRGLKTMQGEYGGGLAPTSMKQAWNATRMGSAANVSDIKGALSSGVSTASAAATDYTNTAKQEVSGATSGIQDRLAAMKAAQPMARVGAAADSAKGAIGAGIDRTARFGRQAAEAGKGLMAAGKHEIARDGLSSLGSMGVLKRIATRAITRGRYALSAHHSQLVQLNARLDELINFEKESDGERMVAMIAKTKGKRTTLKELKAA